MKRSGRPESVAIVGNAPTRGWSRRIDTSDWVVRFNNAPGYGTATGHRVTHLALVNHGGQMAEWLGDPGFTSRLVVRNAQGFLLPFARKPAAEAADPDGRCWTDAAIARLSALGRPVSILPDAVRAQAGQIVGGDESGDAAPSTGLLATLHVLQHIDGAPRIDLYGFGFAGWPGHDFARERAFLEGMQTAGRLRIRPLDGPAHG